MTYPKCLDSFEWAKNQLYIPLKFSINHFFVELESKEYEACGFELNDLKVLSRKAKITPTKTGQFVTCWKRIPNGTIAPFSDEDAIDLLIINVSEEELKGQFVFPKSLLIEQGVFSSQKKEGKRAFRVYPPWYTELNKQAMKSQQWQLKYFLPLAPVVDYNKAADLYNQ